MARKKLGVSGLWGLGARNPGGWLWLYPFNPLPILPHLVGGLRCSFPAHGWGQPGGTLGPRQSPKVGGPHSLAAKQARNRGPRWRECVDGALTSCQLHVSWVGGSLGPCPALWSREPSILPRGGAHALLLVLGAVRQVGVQETRLGSLLAQVPSPVPIGPRAEGGLNPHRLPCPSSFPLEGRLGPLAHAA